MLAIAPGHVRTGAYLNLKKNILRDKNGIMGGQNNG